MYLRQRGMVALMLLAMGYANVAEAALAPGIVWHVHPNTHGDNTNGGGFDTAFGPPPGTGAGTDASTTDAALHTFNGTTTTASAAANGSVLTITGFATVSTDVGNILNVTSGTGLTTGFYEIIAVSPGASPTGTWTLDRPIGAATCPCNALSGKMGGAWTHPFETNIIAGIPVAGNTILLLGTGSTPPNPASPDYFLVNNFTTGGDFVNGPISLVGDPNTPNFISGGRPIIQVSKGNNRFTATSAAVIQDLYITADTGGPANSTAGVFAASGAYVLVRGVVYDQQGVDMGFIGGTLGGAASSGFTLIGCEVFSSVTPGSAGTQPVFTATSSLPNIIHGSNFHNTVGPGLSLQTNDSAVGNIISHVNGDGIFIQNTLSNPPPAFISGNTIDANTGNGINFNDLVSLGATTVLNNIITNHTTASTFGIKVGTGTLTPNNRIKTLIDYNTFGGNTGTGGGDLSLIGHGPHDTCTAPTAGCPNQITGSPYVNQATQNYTLH